MDIFKDIQAEVELFYDDLNWTYMFIFAMVLYGIKHKEEFIWYNKLLDKEPLIYYRVWIAGGFIAALFSVFRGLGPLGIDVDYVSQLLRSCIIIIVFNAVLSDKIRNMEGGNKKKDI